MLVSFKGTLISRKMINLKEKYETGWVCVGRGGGGWPAQNVILHL